ncbi:MAG TPA: energy transducer TonB [Vicinamibacterales bacterium]|nr:energy transducer TonB [Vicinamibacterales bacterium]
MPPASSAGHLALQVDGGHPPAERFLFEQQEKRIAPAAVASFLAHVAIALLVLFLIRLWPATDLTPTHHAPITQLVWLATPGPGGGGGGGGNQSKAPPRKAELPGKDKIALAVVKPPKLTPPKPQKEPEKPPQQLTIPAQTVTAGLQQLPGVVENMPSSADYLSQGSGTGGGGGTGTGTGMGSGQGSGLGAGFGGGTGGGAYRPGNGVLLPQVIQEVKPQYTSDAMRAKIQGTVWLECIVEPNGRVGDVRVIKSLDPTFGLDEEAIKAAKQWRFMPGTKDGKPVPVIITIELTFTLR